jgi:26S proteasome regulatory subunit N3
MGQDVEMKSTSEPPAPPSPLSQLKGVIPSIEKGVASKEMRLMARAIRQMLAVRRSLKSSTVAGFLKHALPPGSESLSRLSPYVATVDKNEKDMDVDSPPTSVQSQLSHRQSVLPEVEMFSYLLVIIFLIDQKQIEEAKSCSMSAVKRLQQLNRRTLDVLAARIYFYYSYSFELTDSLADIRGTLLALHRTATLRHDELGQETLLNLLLRNYLHYNLYDQAEKLRSKTQRSESHSNQQLCRYLYYLGRIRTIQLEYTDAKDCLLQAARKAPASARGFRIQCTKWAAIVRLLLGEIPERTTFMQPGMRKALRPYFELTNAVRIGDLELFRSVAERNAAVFADDKSQNLIVRLRHNVIRTGLRNISISYSRIALVDVATKLHLDSATAVDDAESIVTKAIRDGGIDASVDHSQGWMQSKETGDIYSTQMVPSGATAGIPFSNRILS